MELPLAERPRSQVMLATVMLLVGMASVQVGASFAKSIFPVAGPTGTVALRLAFSTPILWVMLQPWRQWPSRRAWRPLLIYGAVLGIMNLCFYEALHRLPLGIAVAIEFTGPMAVAILASRRAADFLWIALAVAGLAALLPIAGGRGIDPVGCAFALAAAVCWALYIWFGKRAGDAYGARSVAVGSLVAAVLIAPFGFSQAGPGVLDPHILLIGLGVAVLSSALPYTLDMMALTRMPTKTFSTLMSLEPALGALAGLVVLGEHLQLREWAAILAVVVASAGATLTAHRDEAVAIRD
jgi:inner membrane transporter RhtA